MKYLATVISCMRCKAEAQATCTNRRCSPCKPHSIREQNLAKMLAWMANKAIDEAR